jgi:hypothetical protein
MCGQEVTFRLLAATFARDVFAEAPATTPARKDVFLSFVVATGRRIDANLSFALSQSNNHGVSECVGLITAGLIGGRPFSSWVNTGVQHLKRQLRELVYPDGGFSQHSATYHRVLLQDLLWVAVVMRAYGINSDPWLTAAGSRASRMLDLLLHYETGRVPLYGANDGANILPLADGDYLDFRSTIQAANAMFCGDRTLPPGIWDETSDWLGLPRNEAPPARALRGTRHFPNAGCLIWRTADFRVFFRCPSRFRHRPSQADMLHVDVEWRGIPIAHDAGSFSYNTLGPFSGGLKEAAVHNTVTIDGDEPLQKLSRFLYLPPWPRGNARWVHEQKIFAGTHNGWARIGVKHVRRISVGRTGEFVIEDEIVSTQLRKARVHWLLPDMLYDFDVARNVIVLHTTEGPFRVSWSGGHASLVRAAKNGNRGWWSPYYHHAAPALSLAIENDVCGETQLWTRFCPAASKD